MVLLVWGSFWISMSEKYRFGPILGKKREILRVLGQTNKDFLIKILPYDFRVHTMQIISHFTHFRLLIVQYDLLGGSGQFSARVRAQPNFGTLKR